MSLFNHGKLLGDLSIKCKWRGRVLLNVYATFGGPVKVDTNKVISMTLYGLAGALGLEGTLKAK